MSNNNLGVFERNEIFVNLAINQIFDTYGDNINIKPKSLLKFGRNESISSTLETVQLAGSNETFVTDNSIDTFSSSSTSDTDAIKVEGHTITGNALSFIVQDLTLNGRNKVTLSTPLFRLTKAFNNSANNFVGTIYGYEDTTISNGVPSDATKIHIQIDPTKNQSEKASTSFSNVDYGIITSAYGGVTSKRAAAAEFNLQIREYGKVFRTVLNWSSTQGETRFDLKPVIIAPPNSDIRIVAKSDTADTEVVAGFNAFFGLVNN